MAYNLLVCDREQGYLMPPSLRDWLGEGHLAWFILDAVKQMDLSEFYAAYRNDGWGAAAYDPAMMVAVLLYAYCRGLRSSRRLAQALKRTWGSGWWRPTSSQTSGLCAGFGRGRRRRWSGCLCRCCGCAMKRVW